FLLTLAALNVVTVLAVPPIHHVMGFRSTIYAGGYLLNLFIVLAALIAVGFTDFADAARDYCVRQGSPAWSGPLTTALVARPALTDLAAASSALRAKDVDDDVIGHKYVRFLNDGML